MSSCVLQRLGRHNFCVRKNVNPPRLEKQNIIPKGTLTGTQQNKTSCPIHGIYLWIKKMEIPKNSQSKFLPLTQNMRRERHSCFLEWNSAFHAFWLKTSFVDSPVRFGCWKKITTQLPYCAVSSSSPVNHQLSISSWWFQPIWKICSSKWVHLPQVGMNIKNLWVATT